MSITHRLEMIERESSDISIAWTNLKYETRSVFGKCKVILRGLTGHCRYGTVNGLLGPSGAGKTTLLNCLNGKLQSGLSSQCSIYLNHNEPNEPLIRFIQQHVHETMFALLTVRQTLSYAYRFKNKHAQYKHFEKHLQQVLPQLLLDPAILEQRLQVCSGGEIKRIAIAQELMSIKEREAKEAHEKEEHEAKSKSKLTVAQVQSDASDPNQGTLATDEAAVSAVVDEPMSSIDTEAPNGTSVTISMAQAAAEETSSLGKVNLPVVCGWLVGRQVWM